MSVRKIGKILLYCFAGLLGVLLLLMLAVKLALDRAPAYQAEIKQWVHAQTGYHIAFARRVAVVSLVRAGTAFRPAGVALQGRSPGAGARRRRPGRRRHLAADQQRQAAGRQDRTRFAEHRDRAPRSHQLCAGLGDQIGRRQRLAADAHAGRSAGRQAGDSPRSGHHAELELRTAAADLARRQSGRSARRCGLVGGVPRAVAPGARRRFVCQRQCARPRAFAIIELERAGAGAAISPSRAGDRCCRSI